MRVFDVWASSSPPGRNFILVAPSIGKLAREEKSHTQSLTHLFDVPGTEAFASEYSNFRVYSNKKY